MSELHIDGDQRQRRTKAIIGISCLKEKRMKWLELQFQLPRELNIREFISSSSFDSWVIDERDK